MRCPSLSLVIVVALSSTLSNINIAIPAFYNVLVWYIFPHFFLLLVCLCLCIWNEFLLFLYNPKSFPFLFGINLIIDMVRFKATIYLFFICHICSLSSFSFFPAFLGQDWGFFWGGQDWLFLMVPIIYIICGCLEFTVYIFNLSHLISK